LADRLPYWAGGSLSREEWRWVGTRFSQLTIEIRDLLQQPGFFPWSGKIAIRTLQPTVMPLPSQGIGSETA